MLPPPLQGELAAATSLIDLAQRLARVCLRETELLGYVREDPDPEVRRYWDFIAAAVETLDPAVFAEPAAEDGFAHVLEDPDLAEAVVFACSQSPIEHYAFLCGLCRGHLRRFYEHAEEPVRLLDAMPVPFASRRVDELFRGGATPFRGTLGRGHLLAEVDFDLFPFPPGHGPPILLDYSCSERLDRLTWAAHEQDKLPTIGTLHLPLGEDDRRSSGTSRVFDVGPKEWNRDAVLEHLRQLRAAGAQIAVLPELSLPSPDALEASLAARPRRYPPLVVAGSAHVRLPHPDGNREIRANESRTYLDGQLVIAHRKIHRLETRRLGGRKRKRPVIEDLTPDPKAIRVLSGQLTRLAVVICADLIDSRIPQLLEAAGVNLLLVPAMTYGLGSFNGAVTGLASNCQGVTVVVNADLEPFEAPDETVQAPFLVLAGVPRPDPRAQSRAYRNDDAASPPRAIVNPNRRLDDDDAIGWLDADGQLS